MTQKITQDLPFTATKNSIVICYQGQPKTMLSTDANFSALKSAIREKNWDLAIKLIDPIKVIFDQSDGRMGLQDGQVYLKLDSGESWPVPSALNQTIMFYMEEELPFDYLVNFSMKLAYHPNPTSVEQLFPFLEKNRVTIYPDGDFVLYKKVRDNFKDCHTGTMDNSPGTTVSMPREKVTFDPHQTCSAGLHCANWDYAKNFSSGKMLVLKVDPRNVVSVPVDYDNAKIRVCQYYVERECTEEMKGTEYRDYEDENEDDFENEEYEDEEVYDDDEELGNNVKANYSDHPDIIMLKQMFPDEDESFLISTWERRNYKVMSARNSIITIRGNRTRKARGDWDQK